MKLDEFFARYPLFRIDEFTQVLNSMGSTNPSTRKALLAHHLETGRILRIRRGLYASIPTGTSADTFTVDPYLLVGRMTDDSILAYHTALEAYGRTYTVYEQFTYLTKRSPGKLFMFQGATYRGVSHPRALSRAGREGLYVEIQDRSGLDIKVTSLERSVVDVLDRPNLSGSWEEIWRSLESVEFLDLEKVVDYATALENATTVAKVGFYLEQHQDSLMVSENHLTRLQRLRPKSPHYMDRGNQNGGRLVADWNLIVPVEILEKSGRR
jgi:predicted transcriptional regulator of viral defense system